MARIRITQDELNDLRCKIINDLVIAGIIPNCTDTDNEASYCIDNTIKKWVYFNIFTQELKTSDYYKYVVKKLYKKEELKEQIKKIFEVNYAEYLEEYSDFEDDDNLDNFVDFTDETLFELNMEFVGTTDEDEE